MVIRESLSNTWRVVPSDDDKVPEVSADENPEPEAKGQKRGASPSELNAQDLKRRRLSPSTSGPCLAPPPNTLSQKVFEDLRNGGHSVCGSGDVFLTEGFRKRLSLEELGMRALSRLPRERAIDGIHAFNSMREDLVQFLRPFAEGGKVVAEADVQNFFDALKEKQQKQAGGE
ncbi:hypothetical protein VNI00_009646 [Paramarasmius palmivorus]|uniref:Uncharacterized protein n=1 Tax=Paramarasmius palmivorus TaxID=297713 RepID=A0AAW0CNU7_9AGAR